MDSNEDREKQRELIRIKYVDGFSVKASCKAWVTATAMSMAAVPRATHPIVLPLGNGRFTVPIDPDSPSWPIEVSGMAQVVVAVLQDWVESEPDGTFADQLRALPAWKSAKQAATALRHSWGVFAYRIALEQHGLPTTPGAIAFLFYDCSPQEYVQFYPSREPLPTRGVSVLSVALAPHPACKGEAGEELSYSQMIHTISWASPGTPAPLLREAEVIANIHADWWEMASEAISKTPEFSGRQGNRGGSREIEEERHGIVDRLEAGDITKDEAITAFWRLDTGYVGRFPSTPERHKYRMILNSFCNRRRRKRGL